MRGRAPRKRGRPRGCAARRGSSAAAAIFGRLRAAKVGYISRRVGLSAGATQGAVADAPALASASTDRLLLFAAIRVDCGHMPSAELHYLRIPKTGSTSLTTMLWADQKPCRGLHYHSHETDARQLPANASTFTVLRHPCERFVSTYTFVAFLVYGRQRAIADELAAAGSPLGWARYLLAGAPPTANASATTRPHIHAACVRSGACEDAFYDSLTTKAMGLGDARGLARGTLDELQRALERAGPTGGSLMTAQHAYVRASTQLACLPTMLRDVRRIVAASLPDCTTLPRTELHLRSSSSSSSMPHYAKHPAALCKLVSRIYPRDVELYAKTCEAG